MPIPRVGGRHGDPSIALLDRPRQLGDRRMAARRGELTEVGIKVPGFGKADELVVIDDLSDASYRYDEPAQKIFFSLGDDRRVTRSYDARNGPDAVVPARADYGGVLNYTLFALAASEIKNPAFGFSGANATLDARLFGPHGTLSQSAILGSTTAREVDALRLDTTWTYSDPQTLMTYRAGDMISGGLAWTRPIRLGGLQMQRNFALRPDLVTLPLPMVSGSAAVPSTVDVFVNNMKTYSQDVSSGPYQITNLPVLSSGGTALVVLRDAAGREIETRLPFYISPKLLKQGLSDFSVEAGYPRLNYGTDLSTYVDSPIGSASLRRGIYDWLTLETHAEGGSGLVNGGLGTITRLGSAGVLSLAGSASRSGDESGFQSYLAYDTQIGQISVHLSSQRTFGTYNDLASMTARYLPGPFSYPGGLYNGAYQVPYTASARPPKALDTVTVGFPLPFDKAGLSVSYLHLVLEEAKRSNIINVSYSRPFNFGASFYLTAFTDLSDRKSSGVFLGVSVPLGKLASASAGVSRTSSGTNVTVEAAKSIQPEAGSYGWRLRDSEGNTTLRLAAADYRSSFAQFEGTVRQEGPAARGSIQADGAIAVMGGGVFLSNRIDDAFAVVDVGAPNVDVLYENRPAGKTNAQGQLLIPSLRSYQSNKLSIDARDLPVDADVPTTQNFAAPADRSGIVVGFGVKTDVKAAVVILTDKGGKFIAPGSTGRLEGVNDPFVVGYDGRAYIKGLGATNTVVVGDDGGECRAAFSFTPKKNSQVVIGPVVCQ